MISKEMQEINKKVGVILRANRLGLGLSLEAAAPKMGISLQQLQKYESGKNSFSISRAIAICKALGISLGDLVPGEAAGRDEMAALPTALARNYQKLSPEGRNSVMALVRSLAKQS